MNKPNQRKGYNKGWDNLRPAKKGEVRNPKGRQPKELHIPDILRKILDEPCPKNEKVTNLEMICSVAIEQAYKGDKDARNWIADRTEGKAVERIITQKTKDKIIINPKKK